ncbi:uncharacterized protein LOC129557826 isoform X1 [Moschus berezovskii]|uniref:uncharacterized protein LOC129557826 isoform X1 n=2 Tax=Moschus berezovskii TaxID=68408 RepID=UPI002444820A|nr:uncharacterized protein LOC129557826 isoform X1 [Moschus berezovskii]
MLFPGCFVQKTRRKIPQSSRTLMTSWVKRVRCWPHNRVHPITDPVEELSEDELSHSSLEEEALPTCVVKEPTNKNAPQEDMVEELSRACAEEQPLNILKEHGVVYEHGFTEDLPVNPACDRTEETLCVSKVALPACESDCFLESISSSDTEDNADSPRDCCPQTPEICRAVNKDSEMESKNTEISENSLLVYWRSVLGDIKDNKEDLEKQE